METESGGSINRLICQSQRPQDLTVGAMDGYFVLVGEPNHSDAVEVESMTDNEVIAA